MTDPLVLTILLWVALNIALVALIIACRGLADRWRFRRSVGQRSRALRRQ